MAVSTALPSDAPVRPGRTGPAPAVTVDAPPAADFRAAGLVTLAGFALMVAGAIVTTASGADLFVAVESPGTADIAAGLSDVAASQTALMVGLSLWIFGVPTIALGVALLSRLGRDDGWAAVGRTAATVGAGAAVVFYTLLMGVVRGLAPAHAAGEDVIALTRTIGWGAATADWVATFLVLAVATISVVRWGRGRWVPEWLVRFGYVTAVAAVVELLSLAVAARELSFVLVPVGMAYLASIGVVALRRAR